VGNENQELRAIPEDENSPSGHPLAYVDKETQAKIASGERERQLLDEVERLKADKAELHDRLLRRQADFDNFRKRADRDRSDFLQFAGMEFAREMLPILDDFDRALKVETADANYARGVELIYTRMYETLKKMGLEPMDTVGKTFDPNLHQAVERVETDEAEDQTILAEFQKGHTFKGKLLRPAMVKVAVRPS
jgi:molecular chaperone GrpE